MALLKHIRDRIRFFRWFLIEYRPMAGADGEGDGGGGGDGGEGAGSAAGGEGGTGSTEPPAPAAGGDGGEDWKAHARRHEREAKKAKAEAERLQKQLEDAQAAQQTDQEKALTQARKEGEQAAREAFDKERRQSRLEAAVIRLAAQPIKVGEGDDAKDARFADPDDAHVYVERAIANGDVDGDAIFDSDGKVQTDALREALAGILGSKPHLAAQAQSPTPASSDAGRRDGGGGKDDLESLSVEDFDKRVREGA